MVDAIEPISGNLSPQAIPDIPILPQTAAAVDTVSFSIPAQIQLLAERGLTGLEIAETLNASPDALWKVLEVAPVTPISEVASIK